MTMDVADVCVWPVVMAAVGVQPGSPHFPHLNQIVIDQVANGEIEKVRHHEGQ